MLSRTELLAAIDAIADGHQLSIIEIADKLGKSPETVSGWLSSERDYPVARRGARNKKYYSKETFMKVCLFGYALNSSGGVRINGQAALEKLNLHKINDVLALLRAGEAQFRGFFLTSSTP